MESEEARRVADLESALAGRYAIDGAIGTGGMADVYLATDLRHDRKVALKVMRAELTGLVGPQRFLREISIAAKLAHPNIVPLYDSGQAGSLLYYVMPYIEGESLRTLLTQKGQLAVDEALRVALDIAGALEYAHIRGIVHRDIKPENILLGSGRALVTDFGIAKAIEAAAADRVTTGRVAVGTVAYMSPEQASAGTVVDGRSDLYSLALVLYEMLGGEVPFRAPTPDGVLYRKAAGQYPALNVVRATVPEYVDTAIARALAPLPADRFASCSEFASALSSPSGLPVRPRLRSGLITLAVVAGAIALSVTGAAIVLNRVGSSASVGLGRLVVAPLENRTGIASLDPVGLMAGDWITEGLQRTGVVEVVPTSTALEVSRNLASGSSPLTTGGPMVALAAETGAGMVVAGSFYRQGDSLLFHVDVAADRGRRLVGALSDIVAPVSDPMRGIQEVRNRLMGWLALHYDDRLQALLSQGDTPPTYDAYRAFSDAMARYIAVDNAQALPLFVRAFRIDSSFTSALLYASICLTNLGEWASADSLLQAVDRRRNTLSAYHQAWLDYRHAFVRGNHEEAMAAIRSAARLAPESKAAYNHAVAAFQGGHVHEALAAVQALPSDRGSMRGFAPYWTIYGAILHALGRYDRERDIGLTARRAYPDRLWQFAPLVRALAAKGQLQALASAVHEAEGMPADPIRLDFGHLLVEVAEELRAHGYPVASAAYFEQARRWLETNDRGPGLMWRIAQSLYALGRWEDARALVTSLRKADPTNVAYLGMTGLLLSRSGENALARMVADSLARPRPPYEFGAASLYRARIAATLGDRDGAVAGLRRAFAEGRAYHLWLHRDIDLEVLRGYAPFDQLVRGKQ